MGQSTTYPDGSVLTSSALTIEQINTIIQPLTMGMLGFSADTSSPLVRIEWPTQGAPYQDVADDVCYIRCVPKEDSYDRIRDRTTITAADPNDEEIWNYTRAWAIRWCFYGPNSTDRARALRSALYQDYFTEKLSLSQLFPVSDFPEPMRAPELIDGQWFERCDFEAEFYEFITETIARQTVLSVETIVEGIDGQIADVTTTA